jgi:hypothetical protein
MDSSIFDGMDFNVFSALEEVEENVVIKPHTDKPDEDEDKKIQDNKVDKPEDDEGGDEVQKSAPPSKNKIVSTDDDDQNDDSSSDYRVFAEALYEGGVISEYDESIFKDVDEGKEADVLVGLIKKTIDKEVSDRDNKKSGLAKEIIEKIEKGVPKDVIVSHVEDMKKLNAITEDQVTQNEALQEQLVKIELQALGWSEARIARKLQSSKDMGTLEEDAFDSLESIKVIRQKEIKEETERFEASKRQRETEEQEKAVNIKKDIFNTSEFFPGIKLTEPQKERAYKALTEVVEETDGRRSNAIMKHRQKNSIAFDKTLAFLYSLGVFNLDDKNNPSPNWDKLINTSKTRAIDILSEKLKTQKKNKGGRSAVLDYEDDLADSFITKIDLDNFGQ